MTPPIVIDSREQLPYQFPNHETTVDKLDVGDYTFVGFEDRFAVERKTLDDLANSLGADRLRFENEIRRANGYANQNAKGNPLPGTKPNHRLDEFIVMIEANEADVYDFRNRSNCPNYFSNIHPNSMIGTIEKWPNKYTALEFQWGENRQLAKYKTLSQLEEWYETY